jgi:hypothetical protein
MLHKLELKTGPINLEKKKLAFKLLPCFLLNFQVKWFGVFIIITVKIGDSFHLQVENCGTKKAKQLESQYSSTHTVCITIKL